MINNSARTRFAMTLSTLATALLLAAGCSSGAGGSALGRRSEDTWRRRSVMEKVECQHFRRAA